MALEKNFPKMKRTYFIMDTFESDAEVKKLKHQFIIRLLRKSLFDVSYWKEKSKKIEKEWKFSRESFI